jgi:hypothetical protein
MRQDVLVRLTLAVWLVAPVVATAGTVKLTDWTAAGNFAGNAPSGGGPFKAVTVGGPLGDLPGGFLTFCLEFNESFVAGSTYNYELSDNARLGGLRGGGPDGDPVSDATKWLYYNTRSGGYVGLVTTVAGGVNLDVHLPKSGKYFQEAIWFLEGERLQSEIHDYSYRLANNALKALTANPNLWTSLELEGHRVYAMNLTATDGSLKQDQLAYVPVAEPGTLAQLAALGPIGLLGYLAIGASRLVRRRR